MFQTTNQLAWHHPFNDAAPSDDAGELPSGALLSGAWDLPMKVQRGAPKKRNCVQLVNITPITLVYDTQITMFNGVYKPTNITVGPHIVRSYPNNGIPSRMRMLRWDNDFVLSEENVSKTQCLNLAYPKVAQSWPTKRFGIGDDPGLPGFRRYQKTPLWGLMHPVTNGPSINGPSFKIIMMNHG